MNKKQIIGVALCGMIAGVAHGVVYTGDGNWTAVGGPPGWNALPTASDIAEVKADNTVTLNTTGAVAWDVWLGRAPNATTTQTGALTIQNGGALTLGNDIYVGQRGAVTVGTLTVDAGGLLSVGRVAFVGSADSLTSAIGAATGYATVSGTMDIASHFWFGKNGATGYLTIENGGTVTVGGNLGLGTTDGVNPNSGYGFITVNSGGLLALGRWNDTGSIQAGSVLTINDGGTVTVGGDRVTAANDYFTAGKIAADLTGILATYDAGTDATTIVAIPEPATLGMVVAFGGSLLFIRRKMAM